MPRTKLAFSALTSLLVALTLGLLPATLMRPERTARADERAVKHWAFFPPRERPVPVHNPSTGTAHHAGHPIDAFILERLEREGLAPSPPAERATLLRRVSLDLTGLLPESEDVAELVADSSPDTYVRRVDRLLASPRFGEKWARPWLDLCHYADTDGYLTDQPRPVAWRYRQWLIEALNHDLPYDDFTRQQLAGDLLPQPTLEQRLATGMLRNTLSNREGGADLEEFRVEQVVDRVNMVGTIWLGLTMNCCRCHDHKYDPLTQREFFGVYALLDSADEVNIDAPLPGEWEPFATRRAEYEMRRAALIEPIAEQVAALQTRWEQRLLEAMRNPGKDHVWDRQWEVLGLIWGGRLGEGQLEGTQIVQLEPRRRTPDQKARLLQYFLKHGSLIDPKKFSELKLGELSSQLDKLAAEFPRVTRAPAMSETLTPRPVFVHAGGDFRAPSDPVVGRTPAVLPPMRAVASGANRLALAEWLVAPDHPLTARVAVNRLWQELFGQGLVLTTDDFGTRGEPPSHPELLDWLAIEFRVGRGSSTSTDSSSPAPLAWSTKRLLREILLSATYRQSSRPRPELLARDPNNRLLARQSALRLTADQLRDVTLAASGQLDNRIGGPSVFPPQPTSVVAEAFENDWKESTGGDRYRRNLYTYLQRLSPFAQQVTFDAPPLSKVCARRERSNTPLQALTLLNDPVFFDAAGALAERVAREMPSAEQAAQVNRMFQICIGRDASPRERERLVKLLEQSVAEQSVERVPPLTLVASVVLNLHEFLVRE